MDIKWYVINTKAGSEKKVSEVLTRKKIEVYCPFNNIFTKQTEEKKEKIAPLFKNYVFVKVSTSQQEEVKKIAGVVSFVYWLSKPVILKEVEVKAIKLFVNEYSNISLEKINVAIKDENGSETRLEKEAPMIRIKNKKAYVVLESLGYMLTSEVETPNFRIISAEKTLSGTDVKPGKLFNKVSEFNNSFKNYWVKALITLVSTWLVTR